MATEPHGKAPPTGYETRDARIPTLVRLGGVLVALVLLTMVLTLWLLPRLYDTSGRTAPAPLAERRIPPEPRLQVSNTSDLEALRAWEDAQLQGYGWVDRPLGRVRIPIERALQLVAQEGLPQAAPEAPAAVPAAAPPRKSRPPSRAPAPTDDPTGAPAPEPAPAPDSGAPPP